MAISRKFKFTKKKIEVLPPNDRNSASTNIEYSDEATPNLKLFVSKTGRKTFHYRYTIHGVKRSIKIADFDCVPLEEVREIAREYRGMVNRGVDPLEAKTIQSNVPTIREFSKLYLDWSKNHKRSFKGDILMCNKDILPTFGDKRLDQIKRKEVEEYLVRIKERASGTTSNRHRGLLARMFSLAHEWGIYDGENPVKRIMKFPESTGRLRFLSKREVRLLLRKLDEGEPNVSKLLIKFLLFSGLRMGETVRIKHEDFTAEGVLHIGMENAKSKKSRYVQLNRLSLEVVRELQAFRQKNNPYLFPGLKKGQHLLSPKKAFNTIRKKLGFEDVCLHTLRHTFATLSIESGTNLYVVQEQLGHASYKTTQRYAHISGESLKAATEGVADEITKALSE